MKDYYQILGVTESTSEQDIRRRYRKLAMQYHPDRNPDDPAAEEKFKEIAEAYGVLTDPVKRQAYDRACASGAPWNEEGSGGFSYSQEDILRDLFRDPRFQQVFQDVLREFQRSGFRASPQFISRSFFGGRGNILLGGLFFVGSLVGPALLRRTRERLPSRDGLMRSIGQSFGRMLRSVSGSNAKPENVHQQPGTTADIIYVTPLSVEELRDGKTIQVVTPGADGQEMIRIHIPPGSRAGQKLRLRGKGRIDGSSRGDLYLHLQARDG